MTLDEARNIILDIYRKGLVLLDFDSHALDFGPGHIVWSDENYDSAEWCLENFEQWYKDHWDDGYESHDGKHYSVNKQMLKRLADEISYELRVALTHESFDASVKEHPGVLNNILFGKPIIKVDQCQILGKVGDISFCDWSQYINRKPRNPKKMKR